jgi:hypothetical protein
MNAHKGCAAIMGVHWLFPVAVSTKYLFVVVW